MQQGFASRRSPGSIPVRSIAEGPASPPVSDRLASSPVRCGLPPGYLLGFVSRRGMFVLPSLASDFVAQVQCAGGFQRANQVELDVLRRKIVEQPPPLAEQDRPELDLDRVEDAG